MAIQNLVTPVGVDSSGNSSEGEAVYVADVGIPRLSHNRYRTGITATIASGTKTVTFTAAENVRAVRFYFETANLFRVVFDALNDADAQAKLATAVDSASADVQYHLVEGPTIAGRVGWSDWYEFSQSRFDEPLRRIDMVADSAAGPHTVYVEGR